LTEVKGSTLQGRGRNWGKQLFGKKSEAKEVLLQMCIKRGEQPEGSKYSGKNLKRKKSLTTNGSILTELQGWGTNWGKQLFGNWITSEGSSYSGGWDPCGLSEWQQKLNINARFLWNKKFNEEFSEGWLFSVYANCISYLSIG
jgi:hypothetical protein